MEHRPVPPRDMEELYGVGEALRNLHKHYCAATYEAKFAEYAKSHGHDLETLDEDEGARLWNEFDAGFSKADFEADREEASDLSCQLAYEMLDAILEYRPHCGHGACDSDPESAIDPDLVMLHLFRQVTDHLISKANLGSKYPKKHDLVSYILSNGYPNKEVVMAQLMDNAEVCLDAVANVETGATS